MDQSKIKILVVEDDRQVSFHMCRMLKDAGYAVAAAFNLQDALDKFNSEKPDICVIDVYLKFLTLTESGLDFFRIASESKHSFKSIIVSGYCDDKMQEEIRQMPIDVFMPKPLDPEEFRTAVAKIAQDILPH